MRILKEISENEMIAVFLKAEIKSDRWETTILKVLHTNSVNRSIVDSPNINDTHENGLRKKILSEFRGYDTDTLLFRGFPNDVLWYRVLLTKEELSNVLYIDWDYWTEITDGTRQPRYLAQKIKEGKLPDDKEILRFKTVAKSLESGEKFPDLILVAENENAKLVVLEGHLRLTAYFLASSMIPDQLEVIIGFSSNMSKWGNY